MIELDLKKEGEVSINFFRDLLEDVNKAIRSSNFEIKSLDTVRMYAYLYSSLKREIAYAQYRPPEELGRVDTKLSDFAKWNIALEDIRYGRWGTLKEEINNDADELIENPECYEDVSLGYSLQELAGRLQDL